MRAQIDHVMEGLKSTNSFDSVEDPVSISLEQTPISSSSTEREFISFFGFPGVGKSTQIHDLCRHYKTGPFHLGRFSKQVELSARERLQVNQQRQTGQIITGLSQRFLESTLGRVSKLVVFDGFPRSQDDASLLLEHIKQHGGTLKVVLINFDQGEDATASFLRQISRHIEKEGSFSPEGELERYMSKIERTVNNDLLALQRLIDSGVNLQVIRAGNCSIGAVNAAVHTALGDSFSKVTWQQDSLSQIEDCLGEAKIKQASASCGLLYRSFFNDQFGSPRLPIDLHVGVASQEEATRLQDIFRQRYPGIRFKARPLSVLLNKQTGMEVDSLPEIAQRYSPYVWLQGGILLEEGQRKLIATTQCLHDLRSGVLRIDEGLLKSLDSGIQAEVIESGLKRAKRILDEYPALKLEGVLKTAFEREFCGKESKAAPKRFIEGVQAQKLTEEAESCVKGKTYWGTGLTVDEIAPARRVQSLLKSLPKFTEPIPIPLECELPGILGELQSSKLQFKDSLGAVDASSKAEYQKVHQPPKGFSNWIEYLALHATDDQWGEWLINQTKSKNPFCGQDPWLAKILHLDLEAEVTGQLSRSAKNLTGEQKQTHQGTPLYLHLLWTGILVKTEPVCAKLREHEFDEDTICQIRAGIRTGAICHDLGKILDDASIGTPGVHQVLGQKIWDGIKPEWLSGTGADVGRWCVGHHDLLGRLARGLSEKEKGDTDNPNARPDYRGAYAPSACREALKELKLPAEIAVLLARDIWRADVGSVQSLRWLLPAAQELADLIYKPSIL